MSDINDKAQKRIVELGITEHKRALDYEHGYCDGYIQGEIDATNRAVDAMLKAAKEQLQKKKGAIPDAETRPIGPNIETR
jgi:hypothetical protein